MSRTLIERQAAAIVAEGTWMQPDDCTYMAKLCLSLRRRLRQVEARQVLQQHARVYAAIARHLRGGGR